ncbi:BZIP-type transcription factor MBZ1 [Vanrija pseudolonga]|uniref:BZIP-type transcription factor MBZ1 n=1 Tax=Vanrija pseudolonga TaxID=143232 RepID=A0AAF1BH18_9TREE|nr:BZIP-type transcription factor MBZ1 [Vanrija pseudolonga]
MSTFAFPTMPAQQMGNVPGLAELFAFEAVPDLVPNNAATNMDVMDFLNFDEEILQHAESSPESNPPNHTPSPHAFESEPHTYDAGAFMFDFGEEKKPQQNGSSSQTQEIRVKQEVESPAKSSSTPPVPQPQHAAPAQDGALPADQQAALQQLLASFVTYQQQFGLGMNNNLPAAPAAGSIDPSLVFATDPIPSISSLTPASSAAPTAAPQSVPSLQVTPPAPESINEPLYEIDSFEEPMTGRSTRADSVSSLNSADVEGRIDKLVPLSSIFSAGRGKGGKKGGGMSSVVRGEDEEVDEDDSWRPSPEEYKKLSSKEKRQLRNKLSARAFRTRRKDYIGTLEAHIKDRDSVIDAIRAELLSSRAENQDLRHELAALKASTMSVLHPETASQVGQSPAMLKALQQTDAKPQPPTPVRRNTGSSSLSPINTRKDVGAFDVTRGFWGGNENLLGGGGSTMIHAAFTPEVVLPPQPNMNPLLNFTPSTDAKSASLNNVGDRDIDSTSFSEWAESTPYTMKSMDNYRMQMWSRLAREAAADKANISPELRPKFFAEPETGTASSIAALAYSATEHVASKLSSSFWSAFTGTSAKLDTDKLAAVVTGRARLAVVDADKAPSARRASFSRKESSPNEDALAQAMAGLKVTAGTSSPLESLRVRENPLAAVASFFKPSVQAKA